MKSTKEGTCSVTHERVEENSQTAQRPNNGGQKRSGLNGCAQENRAEGTGAQREQAFSGAEPPPRVIVAEVAPRWEAARAGFELAIRVVVGVIAWLVSPLEAVSLADHVEGRLMQAKPGCLGLLLVGEADRGRVKVSMVLTLSEAAMLTEEVQRALGALERGEIPDDQEVTFADANLARCPLCSEPAPKDADGKCGFCLDMSDEEFAAIVPPPRDTEPHPEPAPAPSVFPGYVAAIGEVCS